MLWDILIIGLVVFIISPIVQLFVIWLASLFLASEDDFTPSKSFDNYREDYY